MSECCSRLSSHRGDWTDGSGDLVLVFLLKVEKQIVFAQILLSTIFLHVKPFACDEHQRGKERDQRLARSESWWKKQFHSNTGTYLIKYPASVTLNCDPKSKISKNNFFFCFLFFFQKRVTLISVHSLEGSSFLSSFSLPAEGVSPSQHAGGGPPAPAPHRSSSRLPLPV